MKKGYFAISFADRKKFADTIAYLKKELSKNDTELLVFVDNYYFESHQEKEMMATAFAEIDTSDFLIAELTNKSIGVGIEVGYAFATNKPIIYIRQKEAPYSTTTAGCSEVVLEYKNKTDLVAQVSKALKLI